MPDPQPTSFELFLWWQTFNMIMCSLTSLRWTKQYCKDLPIWGRDLHGQNLPCLDSSICDLVCSGLSSMSITMSTTDRQTWDELKPDRSHLSHFPQWYSKSGHFPIEIPIKNTLNTKIFPQNDILLSITQNFFLTSSNAWVVRRTKLNSKKGVMWDTLICSKARTW